MRERLPEEAPAFFFIDIQPEQVNEFDKIVGRIAVSKDIHPTLFFSKKSQRDFLKVVLTNGISNACNEITAWRKLLIEEELFELLK